MPTVSQKAKLNEVYQSLKIGQMRKQITELQKDYQITRVEEFIKTGMQHLTGLMS